MLTNSGRPDGRPLPPHEPAQDGRSTHEEALAVLCELVRLKDEKDRHGETEDYRANKDKAWEWARRVIERAPTLRSPFG